MTQISTSETLNIFLNEVNRDTFEEASGAYSVNVANAVFNCSEVCCKDGWEASMNDARWSNYVPQRSCGDGLLESKVANYGWILLSRLAKAGTAAVPSNTWSMWRPLKQTDSIQP